eukprot:scaffold689_cov333-Pavlova_lutheri.AAC.6
MAEVTVEDLVRIKGDGCLAVVTDVMEEEDEDESRDERGMEHGMAELVRFVDDVDRFVVSLEDLEVVDRMWSPGDTVVRAGERDGQMGRVIDIDVFVDLHLNHPLVRKGRGEARVIRGINARRIRPTRDINPGDHVLEGNKIGTVDLVANFVTIAFKGGVCRVYCSDPLDIAVVGHRFLYEEELGYEGRPLKEGDKVEVLQEDLLRDGQWIRGKYRGEKKGKVVKVEPAETVVEWLRNIHDESESIETYEDVLPNSDGLQVIHSFAHTCWRVGMYAWVSSEIIEEHGLLSESKRPAVDPTVGRLKASGQQISTVTENVEHVRDSDSACGPGQCCHERQMQVDGDSVSFEELAVVWYTKSEITVQWQDGSIENSVPATSLVEYDWTGEYNFLPGDFVMETDLQAQISGGQSNPLHRTRISDAGFEPSREIPDGDSFGTWKVGIVICADHLERTAIVRWGIYHNPPVGPSSLSFAEGGAKTASVYELIVLSAFECNIGDVVVQVGEAHSHAWAGEIVGMREGMYEVSWMGGTLCLVSPERFRVVLQNYESEDDYDSEYYSYATTQDLGSEDDLVEEGRDMEGTRLVAEEEDEYTDAIVQFERGRTLQMREFAEQEHDHRLQSDDDGDGEPDSAGPHKRDSKIPPEAMELLSRLAKQWVPAQNASDAKEQPPTVGSILDLHYKTKAAHEGCVVTGQEASVQAESLSRLGSEEEWADQYKTLIKCPQFDSVPSIGDHRYILEAGGVTGSRLRARQRLLRKEWEILQKDLPHNIWIRFDEQHTDLLRAAIVGSPGTPYHDNLFIFDLFLPPDYPDVPPAVFYHSYGLRLNPNLYENGKVCLSLLNTWEGKETEVWNPKISNILQILLSVQALVLNEKPYFNEAGYHKHAGSLEGEKNARTYNEEAFLLSCQSMLLLLKNPPDQMEELVAQHFQASGPRILEACHAYLGGTGIGGAFCSGQTNSKPPPRQAGATSAGFKIMLEKLIPKIKAALTPIAQPDAEE